MSSFEIMLVALNIVVVLLLLVMLFRSNRATHDLQSGLLQLEKMLLRFEQQSNQELQQWRREQLETERAGRSELQTTLHTQAQTNLQTLTHISNQQQRVLTELIRQLEQVRSTVEQKLTYLQQDNSQKLELMRQTVEEKLQSTLEQRLGESFKLVSERLEQVHKGLGEMQTLASGVGDLRKVLSNVKTRGTLGELQLANILEQIFSVEQYDRNVLLKPGSQDRVEFAVKLPGPGKVEGQPHIYLPIDSKFPIADYERLLLAQEAGDREREVEAGKALSSAIKTEAKKIRDKYIAPPQTTEFALLFLPFEGLYAEVLRTPGLWEQLQRDYRVVVTGPSTLVALLNSLQMGFRTLAIQKRSSEVWQLLGAIKTKFGEFGTLLMKAQKKIEEAGRTIESAGDSTRRIERKLAKVQQLHDTEADRLLAPDLSSEESG